MFLDCHNCGNSEYEIPMASGRIIRIWRTKLLGIMTLFISMVGSIHAYMIAYSILEIKCFMSKITRGHYEFVYRMGVISYYMWRLSIESYFVVVC